MERAQDRDGGVHWNARAIPAERCHRAEHRHEHSMPLKRFTCTSVELEFRHVWCIPLDYAAQLIVTSVEAVQVQGGRTEASAEPGERPSGLRYTASVVIVDVPYLKRSVWLFWL